MIYIFLFHFITAIWLANLGWAGWADWPVLIAGIHHCDVVQNVVLSLPIIIIFFQDA